MAPEPLTQRPLDLVYVCYFLSHIPATVILGTQALYPQSESLLPSAIARLPRMYIEMSQDPLIGSALGLISSRESSTWFVSLLAVEVFFQLPVFIIGTLALRKDCKKIYVLLLIYGASTVTTFIPSLAVLFSTPLTSPETIAKHIVSVTAEQKVMLLSSYIPFFLVSLVMTIDMAARIYKLVHSGLQAQQATKSRWRHNNDLLQTHAAI
ncbi:DUF2781 domain-containing protein [Phanerochaete sordida]|uniref:DUF2781 domain-containing protein n=1 Tax=Phanerochaete sordida TaxID=48140 RepID=A0A9P3G931_9APHY|nr:DUF2781 domain-containing protein [Phanerochaete sordida]